MRSWIDLCEHRNVRIIDNDAVYHGTSVVAAASILSQNTLNCGDSDDGPLGVSLTSDLRVAIGFAKDVDERELEMVYDINLRSLTARPSGAVLVFKYSALQRYYSIIEHAWDGSDAEHEIRVNGSGIVNVMRFITEVKVNLVDIEWWIAASYKLAEEYGETSPDGSALLHHGIPALENLKKYV